jgi:Helix-turn-helix domain
MFEIGTSLREARLRKGLELAQAESATKIRGKYLRALEEEQFGQLPAQTYVKGFLRTYADYLGLDGQLYVDEFNSRYGVGEEEPPVRTRRPVRAQRRRVQTNVVVAALVGIALLTALVIAAWTSGSPEHQKVVGVAGDETARTTPATPRRPNAAVSITLRAVRSSVFLLVRKNSPTGKVLFNDSLDAGEAVNFFVKRLWINTGSPENLRVTVGRQRVALPGGGPQVFYVTGRGVSGG